MNKANLTIGGFFVLCFVLLLYSANVTPHLTGDGHIYFPENSTPANIFASTGALNLNAGGSNQNINVTPSGNGSIVIPNNGILSWNDSASTIRAILWLDASNPDIIHIRNAQRGTGGNIQFEGAGGAVKSVFNIPSALFGFGGSTAPTYTLDSVGDIRTTTMYRNTSSTAPTASAGSITGNNNSWKVAISTVITTFTVTETGSYAPTTCTVSPSGTTVTLAVSVSGSVISVFSTLSLNGITVSGICL